MTIKSARQQLDTVRKAEARARTQTARLQGELARIAHEYAALTRRLAVLESTGNDLVAHLNNSGFNVRPFLGLVEDDHRKFDTVRAQWEQAREERTRRRVKAEAIATPASGDPDVSPSGKRKPTRREASIATAFMHCYVKDNHLTPAGQGRLSDIARMIQEGTKNESLLDMHEYLSSFL